MSVHIRYPRNSVLLSCILTFFLSFVTAQVSGQPVIRVSPLIWGAQVRLEHQLPGGSLPTIFGGSLGASVGSTPYLRQPDGVPFEAGQLTDSDRTTSVRSTFLGWNADFSRSLLLNVNDESIFSVFIGYWGRLDSRYDGQAESTMFLADPLPHDYQGQLLNSLRTGLEFGRVRTVNASPVLEGFDGEITLEWAPREFFNEFFGIADYTRVTARSRAFLPFLAGGGTREDSRIGLYAGVHAIADYTSGEHVPVLVRSSFGGRSGRAGLAGTVRGYEPGRFDSIVKAAGGLELRLVGPKTGAAAFMPGAVLYLDGGYYARFETSGSAILEDSGSIASSGAGISVSLFDAMTLVFYTNYVLSEELLAGGRFNPLTVGFGYHF